jgi:hypothetical protein
VGLRLDPGLDLLDPLALPLLERRHLAFEGALGPLEVSLPCAEAFLDASLDGRDHLCHPVGEVALAHGELPAVLVGEPSLFGDVGRDGVGLRASDRDTDLSDLVRGLLLGRGAHRTTCVGDELIRVACAGASTPQHPRKDDGGDRDRHERAEQEPGDYGHALMLDG